MLNWTIIGITAVLWFLIVAWFRGLIVGSGENEPKDPAAGLKRQQ